MRLPQIIRYVWTAFGLIATVGTVGIAWGIYALSFSVKSVALWDRLRP